MQHKKMKDSWVRRVLAGILAISMVVIPVNFPGSATAALYGADDVTSPNYFADDFSTSQYLDGVTYKWNSNAYSTSITEEGVYSNFLRGGTKNYLKLIAKNANGSDASANWTNYTFEADIRRDGAKTTADNIYLLGRMTDKGYYAVVFSGNNFALWKVDADGYKERFKDTGSGIGGRDFSDWVHVKLTFRGSRITIILTGNRADGTPVETVHEFTDNTYTRGGVAFWSERNTSVGENWTAHYKNPKVTLENGTVAYSGGIEMGKTKTINGITYSWEETFSSTTNYSYTGGQMILDAGPNDGEVDANGVVGFYRNYVYLAAESYDKVLKKTVDLSQKWENYTVEATVTRITDSNAQAGIMGRVFFDGKNAPSYYSFVLKGDRLMLVKTYYEANNSIKYDYVLLQTKNAGPSDPADDPLRNHLGRGFPLRLKMEFVDNVIRCYYNDRLFIEYVDNGEFGAPIMQGGVGMYVQARGWYAMYDDFLVTPSGDTTSFLDDFTDDRYFKGVTYQLETTEKPEKVNVTYNWTTTHPLKFEDGAFKVDTVRNMQTWSFLNGITEDGTDVDQTWTNYTVEVDVRRDGGEDLCKYDQVYLAGRVNDEGYYALLYNGEYYLNWYDNEGNLKKQIINRGVGPVNFSGWVHLSLTFKEETITCGVRLTLDDGTPVDVSYTVPEKYMVDVPRFSAGGIGFGIRRYNMTENWPAYFKNFKVTLEDGSVVYTDPFNEPAPAPAETATYSWTDKSQGGKKFDIVGGKLTYNSNLTKHDAIAYLQGITDDGINVLESWTDYTVEADIRRENANEGESIWLLGRVNGDDYCYSLGYNGSDLYLYRTNGNHENEASRCRLANVGCGIPGGRANDQLVHIWMTFEGKVIRYGISYMDAQDQPVTKEWSYTEDGTCKPHKDAPQDSCSAYFASGGIGVRVEGSYADLGPDRTQNTGDEDGPWTAYIDNLKVTLADGTVAYYDEFNSVPDSLRQDATYKWSQTTPAGNVAGPDDGIYKSTVKANTKNYAILTGVAEDNANAIAGWKNYIVEADVTRVGAASVADSFYLLGRMGANGGYGFKFSGSTVALCKVDANYNVTVIEDKGSMIGGVTFGDKVHMKMVMVGKRITITLTGKDGDGTPVTAEYSFTDSTFSAGSIGLLVEGTAAWTAEVDNIKVTLGDGTVAYFDSVDSPIRQLTTYTWTKKIDSGRTTFEGIVTQDSEKYYSMEMRDDRCENGLILNGTQNGVNVSQSWSDYKVGVKLRRNAYSKILCAGIMGRMSPVDANNLSKGYVGYHIKLRGDRIYFEKVYVNGTGAITRTSAYRGASVDDDSWYYLEASFVGKTITVNVYGYLPDGSVNTQSPIATGTWTDTEAECAAYMTGGVAIMNGQSSMVTPGNPDHYWKTDYDDFKVTALVGGEESDVLFYEDFSGADYFAGAEYVPAAPEGGYDNAFDADGLTVENGYLPELPAGEYENGFNITGIVIENAWRPAVDTSTANNAFYPEGRVEEDGYTVPLESQWSVVNGSLYKTGTNDYPYVLNMHDNIANYALQWNDYSVELDVMLTSEASQAAVLFNVNTQSQYELRMDGDKVYLLHNSSNTALVEKDFPLSLNVWHFVKVENNGKKINCYVDGSLVITYTVSNAMSGTVGLRAINNVRFDNMAVYANSESAHRKFRSYQFDAPAAAQLDSVWAFDDVSKWSIQNRIISYTGSGMGKMQLRTKEPMTNYFVEVAATPATVTSVMGVIGRANGNSGYTLTVDMAKGLILYRNGVKIGSVSKDDLYLKGIMLLPGMEYTLRLDMYAGSIRCFVNGTRVLQVKDSNPLPAGVIAITQSKDVGARVVTVGETTKDLVLSFVDFDGKVHKSFTVTPGKVPDIKNMYLKVDDGNGQPNLVLLDTIMDDSKFDENAKGTVTIPVEYEGSVINFTYKVVARPEYIKKLNKDIEALNLETVTEEQYKELFARFNDLSFVEKPDITEANQQKLKDARHKINVQLHPMLADYEVVYEQSFDTRDVINDFVSDRFITGARHSGNWYVENGAIHQYYEDDAGAEMTSTGWAECMLKDRSFEVRYISLDFLVHDALTWAGITLHANNENNNTLLYFVSDKYEGYNGNRIRLVKNQNWTLANTILQKELEPEEMYELVPDTWYNLKMIITEDHFIRCYLNGRLFLEYQDKATPGYPLVFDTGSIALTSFEGYHAFDNLVVYGKEVEHSAFQKVNTDLESKYWEDDFQDEKNNVGKNPSHWLEQPLVDKWLVKSSGSNVFYGSKDNLETASQTWLHVFESEIDYSAQLRITKQGNYPTLGLTARVSMRDSFIHAGYDMYLKKWFVQYQKAANWEVKTVYDDEVDNDVDFSNWVTVRVKIVDDMLELYKGNKLMMTVNVEERPGVGRVGIFTERCNVDIDNVKLNQLSGQGSVQDGVLEYYLSDQGFTASMYDILEMPNGEIVLGDYTGVSFDGGATFQRTNAYAGYVGDSITRLRSGNYVAVKAGSVKDADGVTTTTLRSYRGVTNPDGTVTWTEAGSLYTEYGKRYAQPAGHMNEVILADGTRRLFITYGPNHGEIEYLDSTAVSCNQTYYTDDEGLTWHLNETPTEDTVGMPLFTESHVIYVSKDTTDISGNPIPKGTLVHYSNYNTRNRLSYTLSFDGGVTWEGDYSFPFIMTPRGSFSVQEDPYNEGTFYMTAFYGHPNRRTSGAARYHIILMRSYDGLNWNFLCDVDRWDPDAGGDLRSLFHATNSYIGVTKDYVFPGFGRNEMWAPGYNILRPVIHRFEKSKLVDQPWPEEYTVNNKDIVYIEAVPTRDVFPKFGEFTLEGNMIQVHYYDKTSELLDMKQLYDAGVLRLDAPKMEEEGTERVKVVYNGFAATYDVTVTSGHEGGTATCTDRAICDLCGQPYGRTLDHTVQFVKGFDATETTNGMADHYACTACHGTFSDAEGKRKFDAVIPAWVQVEDGEATVDDVMVDKIIDNAADEIVLNLNYEDKFVQDVVFTGEAFKEAAKEGKPFKIITSEVTVTFDATAVQAIADAVNKRNDVTISVKFVDASDLNESQAAAVAGVNVSKILSAQVLSKGKVISDFGGGAVTVRIPGVKDQQLWYLGDDGTVENMHVTFDGEDMVVELYHFSLYAVVQAKDNTGLIILIVALAVLVALVAVVFLVPPVRKKVFGLFQKKKEELPEPEAAEETEITNE